MQHSAIDIPRVNPMHVAYYSAELSEFLETNPDTVIGVLALHHGFALEQPQKFAWYEQIELLQRVLPRFLDGWIYFEFSIPRMGKRVDTVLFVNGVVFVLEFKVGADRFDRSAMEQVQDYALDLKNFHRGSHHLRIVPLLVATAAPSQGAIKLDWAEDSVASPLCLAASDIPEALERVLAEVSSEPADPQLWAVSGYQPTPTIVEAALALYRQHDVRDITRSEAGADNLGVTSSRIEQIIEDAKQKHHKAICFVTGVPGAGKTLAGLNIATSRADKHSDEHAVFLSGNGPLVDVLREALSRDQASRERISKDDAYRKVCSFVQNIHHFRDEALISKSAPIEKVVIFDEAQRAWDKKKTSNFMRRKRGHTSFDMSEPAFLLQAMDRHEDWCVVICLVGGGQEINTGEAGISEWIRALREQFPNWRVFFSSRIDDPDYISQNQFESQVSATETVLDDALHLGVSIRSFRAEALSEFISHLVNNRPDDARVVYRRISEKYPIFLTRQLDDARSWLRARARGTERFGLVASSGALRLRPHGVWVKAKVDAPVWFLNSREDIRSSYYLEEVASEFDVQGLELDWAGVCWDGDFRHCGDEWQHYSFRGTQWQRCRAAEKQLYLKNAYRVLLTRARQGLAICVPHGDLEDKTRLPALYDQTYEYLLSCGLGD